MSRRFLVVSCAIALLFPSLGLAQAKKKPVRKPNPAFRAVEDIAGLPNVLIIGDSISIGYTVAVQDLLKGKMNVHRIPVNGGPTTRGVASIDSWLGDRKWDVIHFNFGLHDLKYVDANLKNTEAGKGQQQVPPKEYRKNLTTIVDRLEKTGAAIIWRPTTPVPAGSASRIATAEDEYNKIAADVIAGRGIAVNDLNAAIDAHPKWQREANVHFTPEGSAEMAKLVAASILAAAKVEASE